MKRILALILTAVLISLLVIPAGTTLADQDFKTIRLPLSLTQEGEDTGHTLRNGMVIRTHTEGPINYFVMSYILNGAKPDTTYDICWEIVELGALYPITVYEGESIQTNGKGNGNLHTKGFTEVVRERIYPMTTLTFKVLFIEAGTGTLVPDSSLPPGVLFMFDGNVVFETDYFVVSFDWDW